ncbi:CMD domain protein [Delftia sp. RIT313]|uniref:CMD domain protein n=1 Tax=Delftia sp. RIT313 TaxID=1468410 RepID=UPI00044E28EF|nr:CMD domain protein [Delftia sp. RIT313]EZP57786.1 family CMD domain-containing protein [Delftia sp. RIT313]
MTMNTTATPRFPGDVIDHLADITPGSALDRVRRHRTEARTQAQQSFAALFTPAEPVPGTVSLRERLALAAFTAGLHGEPRSAVFYTRALAAEDAELAAVVASEVVRGRAQSLQAGGGPHGPYGSYPAGPLSREDQPGPAYAVDPAHAALLGPRLAAALAHAHLLAYHPRDASAGALQALQQAGWSETDIVILSQLASFLSFQIRVVAGLRVLAARPAPQAAHQPTTLQAQP